MIHLLGGHSKVKHIGYFAYGSNMDLNRLYQRGIFPRRGLPAHVEGFALKFNKSNGRSLCGFANIVPDREGIVEGVVWVLPHASLKVLDKWEGVPTHYSRHLMTVGTEFGRIPCYTYLARQTRDGLTPEGWYVDHLLAGERYLSEGYLAWLKRFKERRYAISRLRDRFAKR